MLYHKEKLICYKHLSPNTLDVRVLRHIRPAIRARCIIIRSHVARSRAELRRQLPFGRLTACPPVWRAQSMQTIGGGKCMCARAIARRCTIKRTTERSSSRRMSVDHRADIPREKERQRGETRLERWGSARNRRCVIIIDVGSTFPSSQSRDPPALSKFRHVRPSRHVRSSVTFARNNAH